MGSREIRYIAVVLIVPLLCVIAIALSFRIFHEELPAPPLSNSMAFNEKARWLKNNIHGECDVLIIGSSMALNNLDSKELKILYPGETIVNTASWGLSIEQSYTMLTKIVSLCKPKTIILVTNYIDFSSPRTLKISREQWNQFDQYIRGSYNELNYIRGFELFSFASDLGFQYQRARDVKTGKGRRVSNSLEFDDTGGVNFECKQFETNLHRWDGYKYHAVPKIGLSELDSISSIAETASLLNSQLVVITTPMRPVAEKTFYPDILSEFWDKVKKRVETGNGIYIHVPGTEGFDDGMFVDYLHLNECGSKKLTSKVTHVINERLRQ